MTMPSTNVAKFAAELKMPAEVLLEQLRAAGVSKASPSDELTESDKEQLLAALRRAHGGDDSAKKKITLTRKQTSEIKQADGTGKARTIQVEVRKKRVFVKREAGEALAEAPAPAVEPQVEEAPPAVVDLEQQRLRDEEERRQHELLERQAAELREKQERLEREREREAQAAAEAARREEEARRERERASAMDVAAEQQDRDRAEQEAQAAAEAARKAQEEAEAQAQARRAVEREVAEINRLMSMQRRPQPKAAEPPPAPVAKPAPGQPAAGQPAAGAKPGTSGTLHRPATAKPAAGAAAPGTESKDKKHVKSEKLSSSWHEEGAKRRALKTRGDAGGASGWRAGTRGGARHRDHREEAPAPGHGEPVVREVHVPETITVADLAHKMSVKAAEVIKKLMQLGQMVTI
nr:translation initiation factor IF-2 N-terminal domain-containing protein [Solirubrobacteraceae bacterium]